MLVSLQFMLYGGYISYLLVLVAEVGMAVAAHLQMIVITGGKSIRLYFRQLLI